MEPTKEMEGAEARCFKCKKNTPIKDADVADGVRKRLFGVCAECGTKVSTFVKKSLPQVTQEEIDEELKKRASVDSQDLPEEEELA